MLGRQQLLPAFNTGKYKRRRKMYKMRYSVFINGHEQIYECSTSTCDGKKNCTQTEKLMLSLYKAVETDVIVRIQGSHIF
jgi:hypothetical protein